MRYADDRYHMQVHMETKQCDIPADERTRMQGSLEPLGEAVKDYPASQLWLTFIHHPRSAMYNVEAKLQLPGRTLFTGEQDVYLDSAFQRCIGQLVRDVAACKNRRDQKAEEDTQRRAAFDRAVVAPVEPDDGVLGRAVQAGDYRAFRTALVGYEDSVRKRVGRWVQRYPEAQARIGRGLALGDLVEEVFLNAFERYAQRPDEVSFSNWLEGLIDPSLKLLLRRPDEERENASLARTLRETPLG
jgi:ribosome-associated translation inhibitor RaiA